MSKSISVSRVAASLAVALFVYGVVAAVSMPAQAQPAQQRDSAPVTASPTPAPSPTPAISATENHDLSITANVTARELRFEVVPNPTVEFTGQPRRDTVWEAERTNLPAQVQPGVTYRDIGIRLKITSVFADIERIVAEALGEPSASDGGDSNAPQTPEPNAGDAALLLPPQTDNTFPATINAAQTTSAKTTPARRKNSQPQGRNATARRGRH